MIINNDIGHNNNNNDNDNIDNNNLKKNLCITAPK